MMDGAAMYGIRFETDADGVSAYFPDVPGVGVVAGNVAEAVTLLAKALEWHIAALIKDGTPLPAPTVDVNEYACFLAPDRTYMTVVNGDVSRFRVGPGSDAFLRSHDGQDKL
jgi:predicted RNase H-like HicB family nuclease